MYSFSRISFVPPWFHPTTFEPQPIASIVVLPNGSGLRDKLNTISDNLYILAISFLDPVNVILSLIFKFETLLINLFKYLSFDYYQIYNCSPEEIKSIILSPLRTIRSANKIVVIPIKM